MKKLSVMLMLSLLSISAFAQLKVRSTETSSFNNSSFKIWQIECKLLN